MTRTPPMDSAGSREDEKDALIRARDWDALDAIYAREQKEWLQRQLAEALGDPKTITPEIVAWAVAKAKALLAAGVTDDNLEAARAEARERFPSCGWSFHMLHEAMEGKSMEPFLNQTPTVPMVEWPAPLEG